jgi:hypothetical protein
LGSGKLASNFEAQGIVGLVIFQLVFVLATYAIVHTVLVRAGDIVALPEAELVVMPIVSVCCRLGGECLAWFFASLAVGGGLLILFAGQYAGSAIGQMPLSGYAPAATGVLGAALYVVGGLLTAFAVLIFSYWLAEVTAVMAAIARNTEVLRKVAERQTTPVALGS